MKDILKEKKLVSTRSWLISLTWLTKKQLPKLRINILIEQDRHCSPIIVKVAGGENRLAGIFKRESVLPTTTSIQNVKKEECCSKKLWSWTFYRRVVIKTSWKVQVPSFKNTTPNPPWRPWVCTAHATTKKSQENFVMEYHSLGWWLFGSFILTSPFYRDGVI